MAQCTIKPDMEFVRALEESGGESLKKCYQCATCSVACPLAPPENPFPRKEMLWAQWGLKDKFSGDIDIWLCHNCQTCSDLCPRGARPEAHGQQAQHHRRQSPSHPHRSHSHHRLQSGPQRPSISSSKCTRNRGFSRSVA